MAKLGIAITGDPSEFPQEAEPSKVRKKPEEDEFSNKPSSKYIASLKALSFSEISHKLHEELTNRTADHDSILQCYQERVKRKLKPYVDTNDGLTGFCKMKEAIVPIDTGDERPINRRQYKVPFTLQPVVKAQIDKWLAEGIIERAPKHTSWNNPLLVVTKRDNTGNVLKHRVCIDPRPLNLHIPKVSYPLPKIKDIFESLKGN